MIKHLLLIVLFCGCITREVVVERFVCMDQSVRNHPSECSIPASTYAFSSSAQEKPPLSASDSGFGGDMPCGYCPSGTAFAASKNSNLYHPCGCSHIRRIKPENLVCYVSEEDAIRQGKAPSTCTVSMSGS
jgi:hypothetical protein